MANMAERLGNVLFWASILIAGGWVSMTLPFGTNMGFAVIPAAIIVLIGWALRYILGGRK